MKHYEKIVKEFNEMERMPYFEILVYDSSCTDESKTEWVFAELSIVDNFLIADCDLIDSISINLDDDSFDYMSLNDFLSLAYDILLENLRNNGFLLSY